MNAGLGIDLGNTATGVTASSAVCEGNGAPPSIIRTATTGVGTVTKFVEVCVGEPRRSLNEPARLSAVRGGRGQRKVTSAAIQGQCPPFPPGNRRTTVLNNIAAATRAVPRRPLSKSKREKSSLISCGPPLGALGESPAAHRSLSQKGWLSGRSAREAALELLQKSAQRATRTPHVCKTVKRALPKRDLTALVPRIPTLRSKCLAALVAADALDKRAAGQL